VVRYHMHKSERQIQDREAMVQLVKNKRYVTIAMCRESEPYIVTMNYGYDMDQHVLFFHCALKGLKLDFIRQNPRVCATVVDDRGYQMGQCEHAYGSVVFWGDMFIVQSLDEKKHAMDVLLHHLENKPDAVRSRTLKDDSVYDTMTILRLDIREITGKQSA